MANASRQSVTNFMIALGISAAVAAVVAALLMWLMLFVVRLGDFGALLLYLGTPAVAVFTLYKVFTMLQSRLIRF